MAVMHVHTPAPDVLCVECALYCKSCNVKGADRCDPQQCRAGYVYDFDTRTCLGEFILAQYSQSYSAAYVNKSYSMFEHFQHFAVTFSVTLKGINHAFRLD